MVGKKSKGASAENPPTFKSTELIGDSDDDDTPPPPSQKKAVSFNSKSEPIESPSKVASSRNAYQPKTSHPEKTNSPSSSSEAETGSSEDENEEEDNAAGSDKSVDEVDTTSTDENVTETQPKAATPNAVSRNSTTQHSYNVKPMNGVKRKAEKQLTKDEGNDGKSTRDDEEEDDEEESESGDGEDDGESSSAEEGDSVAQATKENAAVQTAQNQRQLSLYKPPAGFETAKISLSSSSKAADLFKPSNLEGKQIWHITAPSRLPIASIKEVSTTSLGDGSTIISYEGSDYGLSPETGKPESALLLPSIHENQYQFSTTPLSSTFHIRQLVKLSNHVSRPNAPKDTAIESNVPHHQQPPGLKMRFRPFGVSSDSDSDAASRTQQSALAPQFRRPLIVNRPSASKKKKHKADISAQTAESSPAKLKNPKPTANATINKNGSDGMDVETPVTKQKRPEKSPKARHNKSNSSHQTLEDTSVRKDAMEIDLPMSKARNPEQPSKRKQAKLSGNHLFAETLKGKETSEQRAKRKEEKRQQKVLQQRPSFTVNETPSSMHNPSKPKSTAPEIPLAEYSARLSSAEEARAAQRAKPHSSQLPRPGQSSPSEDKGSDAERAKRKEEKKRRRTQLASEGEGS